MYPTPRHKQSWALATLWWGQSYSRGSHPTVPSVHAGLVGCSHYLRGPLCEAEVLGSMGEGRLGSNPD